LVLEKTYDLFIESGADKISGFRKYMLHPFAKAVKMLNYFKNLILMRRKMAVHVAPCRRGAVNGNQRHLGGTV
jgi:hypothetical protein